MSVDDCFEQKLRTPSRPWTLCTDHHFTAVAVGGFERKSFALKGLESKMCGSRPSRLLWHLIRGFQVKKTDSTEHRNVVEIKVLSSASIILQYRLNNRQTECFLLYNSDCGGTKLLQEIVRLLD